MKAFRFHEHGGPDVLRLEDVAIGEPQQSELRIRNTAVAVNFRDVLVRRGTHAVKAFPSGIGIESAGVVEAVGAGVNDFAVGQRVACVAGPDTAYAQARIIPAARAIVLPPAIDERTAAAMMIRGMTARYLLKDTYRVKPGDSILIHAAAGGVGQIVCQWAKHLGATVIGTVGSDEKAAVARAHGCDHALVLGKDNIVERVRALTGGDGVPVVYDFDRQGDVRGFTALPAPPRHPRFLRRGVRRSRSDPAAPAGSARLALCHASEPRRLYGNPRGAARNGQ